MLTKREKEVLKATIDYIEKHGYVLSVREIGDIIGLKSSSTVYSHLTKLEDKGYIERKSNSPRTIKVLRTE